jgi:hypothetical protein
MKNTLSHALGHAAAATNGNALAKASIEAKFGR